MALAGGPNERRTACRTSTTRWSSTQVATPGLDPGIDGAHDATDDDATHVRRARPQKSRLTRDEKLAAVTNVLPLLGTTGAAKTSNGAAAAVPVSQVLPSARIRAALEKILAFGTVEGLEVRASTSRPCAATCSTGTTRCTAGPRRRSSGPSLVPCSPGTLPATAATTRPWRCCRSLLRLGSRRGARDSCARLAPAARRPHGRRRPRGDCPRSLRPRTPGPRPGHGERQGARHRRPRMAQTARAAANTASRVGHAHAAISARICRCEDDRTCNSSCIRGCPDPCEPLLHSSYPAHARVVVEDAFVNDRAHGNDVVQQTHLGARQGRTQFHE